MWRVGRRASEPYPEDKASTARLVVSPLDSQAPFTNGDPFKLITERTRCSQVTADSEPTPDQDKIRQKVKSSSKKDKSTLLSWLILGARSIIPSRMPSPQSGNSNRNDVSRSCSTRLATWRAEAKLLTWAYRIGVNYMLNLRRQTPQEQAGLSLEEFRENLADGLATENYSGPEAQLLAEEVRLTCSQAMLQCLERGERVAFVLGEVFELSSTDAAWILDITPAAYRKRRERARRRIGAFMASTCGLVNPDAFCRCAKRVGNAVAIGRIDPRRPALATHPVKGRTVAEAAAQMRKLHDAATVLRAHPDYAAPQAKTDAVLALLRSGRFPLLE